MRVLRGLFLADGDKLVDVKERKPPVTTILILNAASSLIAAGCLGLYMARQRRRASETLVLPVYVTSQPYDRRRVG